MASPDPLESYEKWLYPSMILWLTTVLMLAVYKWRWPDVSRVEFAAIGLLASGAAVTATVAVVLAFKKGDRR